MSQRNELRESYKTKYPKTYALFHSQKQDKEWLEFVDILIELEAKTKMNTMEAK